jgi:hypothetical protein
VRSIFAFGVIDCVSFRRKLWSRFVKASGAVTRNQTPRKRAACEVLKSFVGFEREAYEARLRFRRRRSSFCVGEVYSSVVLCFERFAWFEEARSCLLKFFAKERRVVKMPEMVASYSSQRFSAMLDFQRDVDLIHPSHIGKKNTGMEEYSVLGRKAPGHHRAHHGDAWQQNWSDSLSAFLSSTFRASREVVVAPSPRPCGVEAARSFALTRSQGQFSPQKFIRNALKRAFARDESVMNVKRARFEDYGSTAEPMVCG